MHYRPSQEEGFTLIELLVVIAIIAILTVAVILTLNPAELLKQARDSNRVSDMATISNALNVYLTDQGTASSFSLGATSATYPSIYDPSATSTAGDQCQGLGMLSLSTSSGQYWQCSASLYFRLVNGTGWIPVNLQAISSGAPIGSLPVDPTNQTSTGQVYSYNTNGSQFEVTANLESSKYKGQYSLNPETTLFPEIVYGGTPTVSALYSTNGLAGYWPLDEGSGTAASDQSGNGNSGGWLGSQSGSSGYYSGGKVGSYAGAFDGTSTYINVPAFPGINGPFSFSLWINSSNVTKGQQLMIMDGTNNARLLTNAGGCLYLQTGVNQTTNCLANNTWYYVDVTFNGTTATIYLNGVAVASGANGVPSGTGLAISSPTIHYLNFQGLIDDVRVYNRALSVAEIQALYNAQK